MRCVGGFDGENSFRVHMWTPKARNFGIKVVDRGSAVGPKAVQRVPDTEVTGGW